MNFIFIKDHNYEASFNKVKSTLKKSLAGVEDDAFISLLARKVVVDVYSREGIVIQEKEVERLKKMASFFREEGLEASLGEDYNINVKNATKEEISNALKRFRNKD